MAHIIWNDLYQQPTLTVSTEKYTTLLHDSTSQLHQSLESALSALDRRAMAFTKLANFESALHDAKHIQQLSPSAALGYLREADIYSQQGKQRHVIAICDKGLRMVDPMDTHYDTLHRIKADAEHRQNVRIDFITQLPSNIVITTIIPLFTNDSYLHPFRPWPYLHVSKQWRERVLQSLNGLNFITVFDESEDMATDSQISKFARHVRALSINYFTRGTWLGDLLRNNNFCMLQKLSINLFAADCVHHLVSSFKSISSSLTHLEIVRPSGTMLPLGDILQTCSNLVSLKLSLASVDDISSLPMITCTTLTTLHILTSERGISNDEIMAIGKRLPALKELSFYPCSDVRATEVVLDYYPWMNSLTLYKRDSDCGLIFLDHGPVCQEKGITDLRVVGSSMPRPLWENTVYILRHHQTTLERLQFEVKLEREQEEAICDIEYSRLKTLLLEGSGWWIPRHALLLEELKISACTISANTAVFDVVPAKLKKLHLDFWSTHDDDHKARIQCYLQRIARHAKLKELAIEFDNASNISNVTNAILDLRQLHYLQISFFDQWDATDMEGFLDRLVQGCPHLICLEIICRNAPSTDSIDALKQLGHLEKLALSVSNTEGDDDFWYALQTLSQLKWLRICGEWPGNMGDIQRLLGQRPDLKITRGPDFISF